MHVQGILCTSISDHYDIFHVASNAKTDHTQTEKPLLKRNMGQRNISNFISEINSVDWQFVLTKTDTQLAYIKFHEALSNKYNAYFPYRKICKRYHRNKPWLSTALKESITIHCVWSRREVMTVKKWPSIRNIETKPTDPIGRSEALSWYIIGTPVRSDKLMASNKTVINKRKYTPISTKFKVNDAITNDGNVIANKFNKLFVNVGTVLPKSMPPTDKNPVDYLQQDKITNLYFDPTTENEKSKIIGSLKVLLGGMTWSQAWLHM